MKGGLPPRWLLRAFVLTALAGAAASVVACSASAPPAPPAGKSTSVGAANGEHAIRVFAKAPDGSSKLLKFGPATEAWFGGTAAPSGAASGSATGQSAPGDVHLEAFGTDGGSPLGSPPSVESPAADPWSTAWALVWRASVQCGAPMIGDPFTTQPVPPWTGAYSDPPGGAAAWYVYQSGTANSCAARVQLEQNLVCVADKLAEIADAVGTVTWPTAGGTPLIWGDNDGGTVSMYRYAEWDIPPQSDRDRFIVRDLAIHTLAMVPTVDAYTDIAFPAATMPNVSSCTQAFAWVAANPGIATNGCIPTAVSEPVFGLDPSYTDSTGTHYNTPSFPPSAAPMCDAQQHNNAPAIAQTALDIEAQILRSSGRLLHDVVRRDVYSDLAAAAQQSAQTLDPVQGNQTAWGVLADGTVPSQGPYGTISHAARVLLGRWEIGDQSDFGSVADPQCEQTPEIGLVPQAFGNELTARVLDRQIRTAGEQTAAQLVERAGIVIPTCQIPGLAGAQGDAGAGGGSGTVGVTALKQALIDQILLQEKNQNHLPALPPATAVTNVVNALSPDEIVFAFARALRTWRLMTDSADATGPGDEPDGGTGVCAAVATSTTGSTSVAGLTVFTSPDATDVAASVAGLQGVIVQGGLSRSRLVTDPLARAGGMMEASQCGESNGYWTEFAVDGTATLNANNNTGPAPQYLAQAPGAELPVDTFQDAFHIGQAIERRLNLLQIAAAGLSYTDPASVARGGIAELRSWAGSAIIHAWPIGGVSSTGANAVTSIGVRIGGVSPADFGIATGAPIAPISNAFGMVYGPPWVAECAAHQRPDCPAGFDASYVQLASGPPTDVTSTYTNTGVLDNVFQLTFPVGNALSMAAPFQVALAAARTPQTSHLYLVLLHDPKDPLGRGRVLGTVPLVGYWVGHFFGGHVTWSLVSNITSLVDAPMQRELVHDAIDLGQWVGAKPPAIGDPSAAETSGYCVDGVPRELFVPLDNELTSGSTTYEDSWQHYLDLAQQAAQTADTLGQQLIANDLQISQNQQAASEQLASLCGDFGALSTTTVQTDGTISSGAEDPATAQCLAEPTTDIVFLGDVPDMSSDKAGPTDFLKNNVLHCSTTTGAAQSPLCNKATLTYAGLKIAQAPRPATTACDSLQQVAGSLSSGFQGVALSQALMDTGFSVSAMQGLAFGSQMVVRDDNSWTVTYLNQTLMDSKNQSYWPACLANGCASLTGLALKQAMYLNQAFRWCPSGSLTQTLGCDGGGWSQNGMTVSNADAELNVLKYRVMQALWMVAMSGGQVQASAFNLPVPVATAWSPASGAQFPFLAAYPGSLQKLTGTRDGLATWQLKPGSLSTNPAVPSDTDSAALGAVYDVAPAFAAFTAHASSEIPTWYRSLYAPSMVGPSGILKHRDASNPSTVFTNCEYQSLMNPNTLVDCVDGSDKQQKPYSISLGQLIATSSSALDGLKCAGPFGEPSNMPTPVAAGTNSLSMWQLISSAKGGIVGPYGNDGIGGWEGVGQFIPMGNQAGQFYVSCISEAGFNCPQGATTWDGPVSTLPLPPSVTLWPITGNGSLSPDQRALQFVGVMPPDGTCGALNLVLQPAAIACASQLASLTHVSVSQPPSISSLGDMTALYGWLGEVSDILASTVSTLYLTEVPTRVVDDITSNQVGTGNTAGAKGAAVLDMEQSLENIPTAWSQITGDLAQVRSAMVSADLAFNAAKITDTTTVGQLALQSITVQGQLAQSQFGAASASFSAVAGVPGSAGMSLLEIPVAFAAASAEGDTASQEIAQLNQLANDADDAEKNAVAQALSSLNQATIPAWKDMQAQVNGIRSAVAKIVGDAQQVQLVQGQAAYQAAIGTGQDFVNIAGQEVPIPVDTVLRRQASATQKRYQIALTNAKALAYMARRAIEQRIGATLDTFTSNVGPLDAPAGWADDICSLQGINYAALSTATPGTTADGGAIDGGGVGGSADQQAISEFADAWVGDYVDKLRNFVTYYNVQYPSHQGQDTSILSLRYDLLGPVAQCTSQSPNLLLYSGSLDTLQSATSQQAGWRVGTCASWQSKCLAVLDSDVLAAPVGAPDGTEGGATLGIQEAAGGVSWLLDVASTPTASGGGTTSGPGNLVYQSVTLSPGTYVLSWWDQARNGAGQILYAGGAGATPYLAEVLDPSGQVVGQFTGSPYTPPPVGDAGGPPLLWSARNEISFTVAQGGTYTVAFAASLASSTQLGSVAIADAQLEVAPQGQPSPYVATGATTQVPAFGCPMSDADLRGAFTHNCDNQGVCSYDLDVPLIVDTTALGGAAALGKKLADGNYNYRDINIALNLVGTNVHSCANDPNPNCYGSAYVQYDLQHDASNAGIIGFDGNSRIFDFGVATINHGKALAAERYLTMPLSSNDQQLISQPGIEHIEFGGRPLDGAYHLRIWDSPDLNWSALQDVQIILNYEYWSQIDVSGNTGAIRPPRLKRAPLRPIIVRRTAER